MSIPAHQQRVLDERRELTDKFTKLGSFITTNPIFSELDQAEQQRLVRQHACMGEYVVILTERIDAFQIEDDILEKEPKKRLPFGEAIAALKKGKRVSREGWNGKGLFVFMQVPAVIGPDIVPQMQSLPDSVKTEFQRRDIPLRYHDQMALVKPDNTIQGWAPSAADALADDWVVLD